LRTSFAEFDTAFTEVVDLVPYEETLKQLARERYKAYRVPGFNLNTATWK
ncbi:DNA polymerase III subunit chi, partial [Salmonella enterica subsp. enterica serovar Infantis]